MNSKKIYEYYRDGHSMIETAREFGVRATVVRNAVIENGGRIHVEHRHHSESTKARAIAFYKAGFSYEKVSRIVGIPEGTVQALCEEAGIERHQKRFNFDLHADIAERLRGGANREAIAEELGCTVPTVRKVAKEIGMEPTRKGVQRVPDEIRFQAALAYENGATLREVSARYHISTKSVRTYVCEFGGTIRAGRPRTIAELTEARRKAC